MYANHRDVVILTERERSLSSRHGGLTNSVFSVCCILPQFLTLSCYRLFFFKSFYLILFMTEKYAKGPGTGLVSRMKLCSWVLRHHSVASFFSLLSLRSKFGNGVTRSPRINSNKPFHRSNIPRSISSFLAHNNYDSQQCRISFFELLMLTTTMFVLRNCLHSLDNCKQVCITLVYSQFSQQCRFVFKVTPARVFKRKTTTQANHCNKVRYLKTASIIGAYWSF